jgi:hypothetical protein
LALPLAWFHALARTVCLSTNFLIIKDFLALGPKNETDIDSEKTLDFEKNTNIIIWLSR